LKGNDLAIIEILSRIYLKEARNNGMKTEKETWKEEREKDNQKA
jgi:hypothetical protein